MNVSASLFSKTGDEYRISLMTVDDNRLSEGLRQYLHSESIEIAEVFLDRNGSKDSLNTSTLFAISKIIANLFFENNNLILYFYCDDLGIIPNISSRHRNGMLPQEYRSNLFTSMFNRYMANHHGCRVKNYPMHIDNEDERFKAFLHFIAREEHARYIDMIKQDVIEGYGK